VLTLRLSVLYGLLRSTTLTDRFCITEVEIVYCAVRTESLYKTESFIFKRLSLFCLQLFPKIKYLFVESQVNFCLDVTVNIWVFYGPPSLTLRNSELSLRVSLTCS
jgi:hypothetical protein